MYVYLVFLNYWNWSIELQVNKSTIYWTGNVFQKNRSRVQIYFNCKKINRRSLYMSVYIIIHKIFNLGWSFRHWSTMIWIKHGIIPSNHFSNCKKCIKTLNIWKQLCVTIKINNNIKQDICEQMLTSDTPTLISIFKISKVYI